MSDRSDHVDRLTRDLDRCAPAERDRLRLDRAVWARDADDLLAVLGDRHPDTVDMGTGGRLLPYAITIAGPAVVQALLDRGADVNYRAADGFPALVSAILHEDDPEVRRATVRVLIGARADLERDGFNGWSPLHAAALTDDPDLVRILLDAGADPHVRAILDDGWTAAEEAEQAGCHRAADAIREWVER